MKFLFSYSQLLVPFFATSWKISKASTVLYLLLLAYMFRQYIYWRISHPKTKQSSYLSIYKPRQANSARSIPIRIVVSWKRRQARSQIFLSSLGKYPGLPKRFKSTNLTSNTSRVSINCSELNAVKTILAVYLWSL